MNMHHWGVVMCVCKWVYPKGIVQFLLTMTYAVYIFMKYDADLDGHELIYHATFSLLQRP